MQEELQFTADFVRNARNVSGLVRLANSRPVCARWLVDNTPWLKLSATLAERCYHIRQGLVAVPGCPYCDEHVRWCTRKHKPTITCGSPACVVQSRALSPEQLKAKTAKTKATVASRTPEEQAAITAKGKQTLLCNYGVDSYAKTDAFKAQMVDKFGGASPFSCKKVRDKSKATFIDKYGCDHNMKVQDIVKKVNATNLLRYGHSRPAESDSVKAKARATNMARYGHESPMQNEEVKRKSLQTLQQNYGVSSPLASPAIRRKYVATMLQRYGYAYVMQDESKRHQILLRQSSYKVCAFKGAILFLQGYEDYVLRVILQARYVDEDLFAGVNSIRSEIGDVWYSYNGTLHKYYPDFYIESENKVVEVKSAYTVSVNTEVNELKRLACIKAGLAFELIVVDKDTYNTWKKSNQVPFHE